MEQQSLGLGFGQQSVREGVFAEKDPPQSLQSHFLWVAGQLQSCLYVEDALRLSREGLAGD